MVVVVVAIDCSMSTIKLWQCMWEILP